MTLPFGPPGKRGATDDNAEPDGHGNTPAANTEGNLSKKPRKENDRSIAANKLQAALKAAETAVVRVPTPPDPTVLAPDPLTRLPLGSLGHRPGGHGSADALAVWDFVQTLGGENGLIKLQPFTVEDLCSSLLHPGEPVLLAELSCALLRTLLADSTETIQVPPPVYSEVTQPLLLRLPPTPEIITRTNWPEVIRCVGWILPEMHEEGAVNAALYALQENEYSQLPPNYRLTLLKSLCDACLSTTKVKTFLKERAERQEAMGVAARKEQAAANKQLREELAAIVPEEGLDPTATGKVFALVFPAVAAPTTNTTSSSAASGGGGGGEAPRRVARRARRMQVSGRGGVPRRQSVYSPRSRHVVAWRCHHVCG